MKKNIVALSGLLILLTSCTSTKMIYDTMNSNSFSLVYLQESTITQSKHNIGVAVDSIFYDTKFMPHVTSVENKKNTVIPLLIFAYWNSKFEIVQGQSMIEEFVPDFLRTSIENEIERSGNVYLDNSDSAEYSINLSIDSVYTHGGYNSSGYYYITPFAYGVGYSDNAGPGKSTLLISYELLNKGVLVHSNQFEKNIETAQLSRSGHSLKSLQTDYAISLVEALSNNMASVISEIVLDLNSYFRKEYENIE